MSLSDFVGLSFTRSSTSTKYKIVEFYRNTSLPPYEPFPTVRGEYSREFFLFRRQNGIARPKLMFRYERLSWQRALNAISLLVGFLPRK